MNVNQPRPDLARSFMDFIRDELARIDREEKTADSPAEENSTPPARTRARKQHRRPQKGTTAILLQRDE